MDSDNPVCPVCGQPVERVVKRHKTLGAWVPVWAPGPCRDPRCPANAQSARAGETAGTADAGRAGRPTDPGQAAGTGRSADAGRTAGASAPPGGRGPEGESASGAENGSL